MQDSQTPPAAEPSRRGFFLSAAGAGAVVTAAAVLPRMAQDSAADADADAAPQPAPEKGGGYRLSEHVRRYYRSTSA